MLTAISDIPMNRLMSCEWVIITHQLGNYLFENDRCFSPNKELCLIKCGGSVGYKLNGKFRSLTWLKYNRKPIIKVMIGKYELIPF